METLTAPSLRGSWEVSKVLTPKGHLSTKRQPLPLGLRGPPSPQGAGWKVAGAASAAALPQPAVEQAAWVSRRRLCQHRSPSLPLDRPGTGAPRASSPPLRRLHITGSVSCDISLPGSPVRVHKASVREWQGPGRPGKSVRHSRIQGTADNFSSASLRLSLSPLAGSFRLQLSQEGRAAAAVPDSLPARLAEGELSASARTGQSQRGL